MDKLHSNSSILSDNQIVDNYLRGLRICKNGSQQKLDNTLTKFNKQFLVDIKTLSDEFNKLINTSRTIVNLIEQYPDYANNTKEKGYLLRLIYAQAGTVEFNNKLKRALKTYEVRHESIYESIKNSIEKQYDRLKRNKDTIYNTINDIGLGEIIVKIQEKTGMDFIDYIEYLENTYNEKEETKPYEDETYYKELNAYKIDTIRQFAIENSIDIDKCILESLKIHKEKEKQKQKDKNKRINMGTAIENGEIVVAIDRLDKNSGNIQIDILRTKGFKPRALTKDEATLLYKAASEIGVCYYISLIDIDDTVNDISEQTIKYYMDGSFVEQAYLMTLFESLQEANRIKAETEEKYNNENRRVVCKVYRLVVNKIDKTYSSENTSKAAQQAAEREKRLKQEETERLLHQQALEISKWANISVEEYETYDEIRKAQYIKKYNEEMHRIAIKNIKERIKKKRESQKRRNEYLKKVAEEREKSKKELEDDKKKQEKEEEEQIKKALEEQLNHEGEIYNMQKEALYKQGDIEAYVDCLVHEANDRNYFTGGKLPSSYFDNN